MNEDKDVQHPIDPAVFRRITTPRVVQIPSGEPYPPVYYGPRDHGPLDSRHLWVFYRLRCDFHAEHWSYDPLFKESRLVADHVISYVEGMMRMAEYTKWPLEFLTVEEAARIGGTIKLPGAPTESTRGDAKAERCPDPAVDPE